MILALSVARPRPLSPRTRNKVVRASEEAGFSAAPPWKMKRDPPADQFRLLPPREPTTRKSIPASWG